MIWKIKDGQTITEPVSLAQLKTHLRVEHTLEDDLITSLGKAARLYIEQLTDQILTEKTILVYFDQFPSDCLVLPVFPIQSITSIQYLDENSDSATWDNAKYRSDLISRQARIAPINSESFPNTATELNAVTLELVAGYGDASQVPDLFKTCIKLLVAELYEHRQNRVNRLPTTVIELLKREMDFSFA